MDVLFPFLECKNDSEEFMIIDVVISLCRDKHFGEAQGCVLPLMSS